MDSAARSVGSPVHPAAGAHVLDPSVDLGGAALVVTGLLSKPDRHQDFPDRRERRDRRRVHRAEGRQPELRLGRRRTSLQHGHGSWAAQPRQRATLSLGRTDYPTRFRAKEVRCAASSGCPAPVLPSHSQ